MYRVIFQADLISLFSEPTAKPKSLYWQTRSCSPHNTHSKLVSLAEREREREYISSFLVPAATQKALQHTWDISHTNCCCAHTAQKWLQCAVGTARAVTAQSEVWYLTSQADYCWVKAGLAVTPVAESMKRVQFLPKITIKNSVFSGQHVFPVCELNRLYFSLRYLWTFPGRICVI